MSRIALGTVRAPRLGSSAVSTDTADGLTRGGTNVKRPISRPARDDDEVALATGGSAAVTDLAPLNTMIVMKSHSLFVPDFFLLLFLLFQFPLYYEADARKVGVSQTIIETRNYRRRTDRRIQKWMTHNIIHKRIFQNI